MRSCISFMAWAMTSNSRRPAGSMGTACRVRPKLRAAAVSLSKGRSDFLAVKTDKRETSMAAPSSVMNQGCKRAA